MANLPDKILEVLEAHDGLAMDNAEERILLTTALADHIGREQFLVVRSERGLIADAVVSPSLHEAEQNARGFLVTADLDTDDAAVLRLTSGQVHIVTTSKVLLASADQ